MARGRIWYQFTLQREKHMPTVFLTHPQDALHNYYGPRAIEALQALAEVRFNPLDRELSPAELIEAAKDCVCIVSYRGTPGSAELFAQLPKLVSFSRCAIDIRNIDVNAASAHGILVTQASAGFIPSVSEWIIGTMIDLGRHVTASSESYHRGEVPAAAMGRELRHSTLGVIGYGQISRYLCRLATAFGMRVVVNDPFAAVDDPAVTQLGQEALLEQSDFVVCLAVANEQTENLMNAEAFARMRPGAYFINASRGNLVDEAALLAALDSGHIAGCAMDVGRAPDQMPSPELARHPRAIATPHTGGLTPQAIEHQAMDTVRQVEAILQGRVPEGAVNAAHAKRLRRLDCTNAVAS
jgi:D-3-phosphoglycerate dehydrogenase